MINYILSSPSGNILADVLLGLLLLPVILLSLTLHECAHGWAASKLGDNTAKNLGRLTLDPAKHLDLMGTICMLLFGFGWAKPVPINSRYFKKPRRDMALSALAGPTTNLLLGFVFILLSRIVLSVSGLITFEEGSRTDYFLFLFYLLFSYAGQLNVYLAVFNLLPIPPFDGSRIFFIFLPVKWYFGIMKYERYIQIAILVLLWLGVLTIPLSLISGLLISLMNKLIDLIPFL